MSQVLEAAKRIAARFKTCEGKPVPCKEDCQCVREARKMYWDGKEPKVLVNADGSEVFLKERPDGKYEVGNG